MKKTWFKKSQIQVQTPTQPNDLRGEPAFACICGCAMFRINVMWDQDTRAVGWYDLAQECIECGTITTAPTEIDGCE